MGKLKNGYYLYFIECPLLKVVKIGRTVNMDRRLDGLRSSSPTQDLHILAVFPNRGKDEKRVHQHWMHRRSHGEWFHLKSDIRRWIEAGADLDQDKPPYIGKLTGKGMKRRREKRRMSEKELAKKLGLTEVTIRNYEADRTKLSYGKLREAAKLLGVRLEKRQGFFDYVKDGNGDLRIIPHED